MILSVLRVFLARFRATDIFLQLNTNLEPTILEIHLQIGIQYQPATENFRNSPPIWYQYQPAIRFEKWPTHPAMGPVYNYVPPLISDAMIHVIAISNPPQTKQSVGNG